jgi:hypothetical protein
MISFLLIELSKLKKSQTREALPRHDGAPKGAKLAAFESSM